ncbi:hypothetical protein N7463_003160 [Penicillium fimorum]|uniref:Uncharacterized protein n=1 Tax=Penicillium fimorum TaxID=1882269 RepID=A0A9W9Y0K4_9EURO|nr:hypothetical protein N7463_003160 [Penicillium fimorum]
MATSALRNQSITLKGMEREKGKGPTRCTGKSAPRTGWEHPIRQAKHERFAQFVWAHTVMGTNEQGLGPVKKYILTPAHLAALIIRYGAD